MRWTAMAWTLPALFLGGCEEEVLQKKVVCTKPAADLRTEDLSQLELVHTMSVVRQLAVKYKDKYGKYGSYEGGFDGLEQASGKAAEGVWRVKSVDVLIGIPSDEFNNYPATHKLAVQIYELNAARQPVGQPYEVVQTLDPSLLSWEEQSSLRVGDSIDENTRVTRVKKAWWRFDFSKVIPSATGLTTPYYVAGIRWFTDAGPLAGSSENTRNCGTNWYDYGDGTLQHGDDSKNSCTWPMLRIASETVAEKAKCD